MISLRFNNVSNYVEYIIKVVVKYWYYNSLLERVILSQIMAIIGRLLLNIGVRLPCLPLSCTNRLIKILTYVTHKLSMLLNIFVMFVCGKVNMS